MLPDSKSPFHSAAMLLQQEARAISEELLKKPASVLIRQKMIELFHGKSSAMTTARSMLTEGGKVKTKFFPAFQALADIIESSSINVGEKSPIFESADSLFEYFFNLNALLPLIEKIAKWHTASTDPYKDEKLAQVTRLIRTLAPFRDQYIATTIAAQIDQAFKKIKQDYFPLQRRVETDRYQTIEHRVGKDLVNFLVPLSADRKKVAVAIQFIEYNWKKFNQQENRMGGKVDVLFINSKLNWLNSRRAATLLRRSGPVMVVELNSSSYYHLYSSCASELLHSLFLLEAGDSHSLDFNEGCDMKMAPKLMPSRLLSDRKERTTLRNSSLEILTAALRFRKGGASSVEILGKASKKLEAYYPFGYFLIEAFEHFPPIQAKKNQLEADMRARGEKVTELSFLIQVNRYYTHEVNELKSEKHQITDAILLRRVLTKHFLLSQQEVESFVTLIGQRALRFAFNR